MILNERTNGCIANADSCSTSAMTEPNSSGIGEDQREQQQYARERREQPMWTRTKWWILGEPE
jgi:hypothetical protein